MMGYLSTYYNTFLVVWGYSFDVDFSDLKKYPTMSSIMPNAIGSVSFFFFLKISYSRLGYIANKVLEYFQWSRVSVLYMNNDVGYCESIANALEVGEVITVIWLILDSFIG